MMTIISAIMTLNPIATLVALISHITIGAIWYHPSVFGQAWIKLRGMVSKPDAKWIVVGMVAHVIYLFVLAVIVNLARATTALEGLAIGIMVSVGFIGTMLINELIYGKLPFKLFLIKLGDEIISLGVAGIILALWK